MLLLIMVH